MSVKPLFSILHTSARPDKWRAVYDDWMSKAVNPERVEYVLCVDPRWGFSVESGNYDTLPTDIEVVQNTGRKCYVDGVNIAAKASSGSILIVNADDQFACDGWDEKLVEAFVLTLFPETRDCTNPAGWIELRAFVLEVSTGTPNEHDRGILVMPILSRARYEKQGGFVFYPEYESMFADNDFCLWARQDGVVIDARHLMFPHQHPMRDKRNGGLDEAYKAQMRPEAFKLGETLFAWRKRTGFGEAIRHAATIEGWMFPNELECLSSWASQHESIVEIGSWKGRSTYALCKGTAGRVWAVDTFKGSPDEPEHVERIAAAGGSTFEEFDRNTEDCPNLSSVALDSVEAAAYVPDADMVFLDGGHSYEQVLADLKAWLPKTKKLICGHDIQAPGVARAVREVLGEVERGAGSLWFKQVAAKRRTIAMCYPGDDFRGQMHDALLNLYAHLIQGFDVIRMRTYTPNVYTVRESIRRSLMNQEQKPALVLWMDHDNPLQPGQFDQLLADLDSRPEIDGVSGWCWIYNEETRTFTVSCGEWAPDHLHWTPFPASSFVREQKLKAMECGGFPCFLMRYSALEKVGEGAFLPIVDNRLEHGLLGEDFAFFLNAEKGGARFLVDPRVKVPHLKYVGVEPVTVEQGAAAPVKVACMIRAKNEGRWIARVIEAVKPLCGNLIFVMEDGSTDDTAAEAARAGADVIHSPFAGQGLDERRDKNWLLKFVNAECSPDWILMPDADEELEPNGAAKIRAVLESDPPVDVFALRILNLWNALDTIRLDGVYGNMYRQSLFRAELESPFKSFYEGEGKNHNHVGLHTSNAPGMGDSLRHAPLQVSLLHYGPLLKEDRLRKFNWITNLDPANEEEGRYLHMVQGDLPAVPSDLKLKHAGPLKLEKLPPHLIPKWDVMPKPFEVLNIEAVGSSASV